jgi:hypothetical protein
MLAALDKEAISIRADINAIGSSRCFSVVVFWDLKKVKIQRGAYLLIGYHRV